MSAICFEFREKGTRELLIVMVDILRVRGLLHSLKSSRTYMPD